MRPTPRLRAVAEGGEVHPAELGILVEPSVLAFHEDVPGLRGAVGTGDRRAEYPANGAQLQCRRKLVGEGDERRLVNSRARPPGEPGQACDERRVGLEDRGLVIGEFIENPAFVALGPFPRGRKLVEEEKPAEHPALTVEGPLLRSRPDGERTGEDCLAVRPCGHGCGDRVELPRSRLRGVPPLLIPYVLQCLVRRAAGVHEAHFPACEGSVEVEPLRNKTVGEMSPYIILGQDGKGMVAGVNAVSWTRVKRLPGLVYRGAVEGRLKSFETPTLVMELCCPQHVYKESLSNVSM